MQRIRAFTLIELLVVISIIALLLAILLPVLSRTKESSRRIQCASNARSLMQGHVVLAEENKGNYRLNNRSLGGRPKADTHARSYREVNANGMQDHVSFLNRHVFIDMVDAGIDVGKFTCPNRGVDFIVPNGAPAGEERLALNDLSRYNSVRFVRTAFYQLAGRDQRAINSVTPKPGDERRIWRSPTDASDPGDLPMVACMLEKGTINPRASTFPHGPKGMIETLDRGNNIYPEDTGSEGGNVAANDGSVQFVPTNQASRFTSHPGAGNIVGHWQDVDSYDSVNP